MRKATGPVVVAALAVSVLAGGAALAAPHGDSGQEITGDALARASRAALDATGGGTVTGTEVGDEDSYYEVEVTLDGRRQVDVQLDEAFAVVATTTDEEETGHDPGDG